MTDSGRVGTVVPDHDEFKSGTLRGILRLAQVEIDELYRFV
jgi:hypothetical protein